MCGIGMGLQQGRFLTRRMRVSTVLLVTSIVRHSQSQPALGSQTFGQPPADFEHNASSHPGGRLEVQLLSNRNRST